MARRTRRLKFIDGWWYARGFYGAAWAQTKEAAMELAGFFIEVPRG